MEVCRDLLTDEFDYNLPEELIATNPSDKRDGSRFLILDRKTKKMGHSHFYNIVDYLNKGDVLVLNNTKVMPSRLFGKKMSGGKVEILLLKKISGNKDIWECMVQPAKRLKKGYELIFEKLKAIIVDEFEDSRRLVEFFYEGNFNELINEIGNIPLPPYILSRLSDKQKTGRELLKRYQTIYADKAGASAAPTAGLHFTDELLNEIKAKGVSIVNITLHTGMGTFKPVVCEYVKDHKMFHEEYEISEESAEVINRAKKDGGKVIAVGTTSVRTLEDCYLKNKKITACKNDADIFVYPPFKFNVVDKLITNFHFPKSTLLMLVSAFAGQDFISKAYEEAIKEKYRFYSFGDAMMII